jgi:uncharacterized protein YacL
MINKLHTLYLYIATTVIIAAILSLLTCSITGYFFPSSHMAMIIAQFISWVVAIIIEVLFVRCRPLSEKEKNEMGTLPKIQLQCEMKDKLQDLEKKVRLLDICVNILFFLFGGIIAWLILSAI